MTVIKKTIADLLEGEAFIKLFALFIFLCCMVFFFWLSFYVPKGKDMTHVGDIKTAMISICTLIVGYFFGSSRNASNKDAIIKDMTASNKTLTDNAGTGTK